MNRLPEDASLDDWKQAYREVQLQNTSECLREDEMIAMANDKVRGIARLALADHIVACRHCTDAYQLLLRVLS